MVCLGALWTLGEGTVRQVAAELAPRRQFAYTTVLTLLERLVRRGHLTRRKAGRSFTYIPAHAPDEIRQIATDEFVQNFFGGSREALRKWLDVPAKLEPSESTGANPPIDTALL